MHALRRRDRALDADTARALLEGALVGRLGTASHEGPYITPLSYAFVAPDRIYFHCAPSGRKLDNLQADSRVCFEVDEMPEVMVAATACESGVKYRSVVAFGTAIEVTDEAEKMAALSALVEKYTGEGDLPLDPATAARTTVIAIQIEELTGKGNY